MEHALDKPPRLRSLRQPNHKGHTHLLAQPQRAPLVHRRVQHLRHCGEEAGHRLDQRRHGLPRGAVLNQHAQRRRLQHRRLHHVCRPSLALLLLGCVQACQRLPAACRERQVDEARALAVCALYAEDGAHQRRDALHYVGLHVAVKDGLAEAAQAREQLGQRVDALQVKGVVVVEHLCEDVEQHDRHVLRRLVLQECHPALEDGRVEQLLAVALRDDAQHRAQVVAHHHRLLLPQHVEEELHGAQPHHSLLRLVHLREEDEHALRRSRAQPLLLRPVRQEAEEEVHRAARRQQLEQRRLQRVALSASAALRRAAAAARGDDRGQRADALHLDVVEADARVGVAVPVARGEALRVHRRVRQQDVHRGRAAVEQEGAQAVRARVRVDEAEDEVQELARLVQAQLVLLGVLVALQRQQAEREALHDGVHARALLVRVLLLLLRRLRRRRPCAVAEAAWH
eukprot:Rhum_TRINITY_DN14340_c9_g1::Rhum_TRINITY_DN14340_c9_g1_i1::g.83574::m.83574